MNLSQIIYVTDPLCLWCYGIAPDLEKFYQNLPSDIERITINGGLFPNTQAKRTDKAFRDYLKNASKHVTERTGQIFSEKFWALLETDNYFYDTEPAARASVTVKLLKDDATMQHYIHELQQAVFVEGLNPNDPIVLASIAEACGIPQDIFLNEYHSDSTLETTRDEYAMARQLGIQGFPALLYAHDQKGYKIASGYASFSDLENAYNWARGESGQPPLNGGAACDASGCSI